MNVAENWPEMQGRDMTSPQEIETLAQFIGNQSTQEARHKALAAAKQQHSGNVYELIRKRAVQIHRSNHGRSR